METQSLKEGGGPIRALAVSQVRRDKAVNGSCVFRAWNDGPTGSSKGLQRSWRYNWQYLVLRIFRIDYKLLAKFLVMILPPHSEELLST